MADSHWPDWLYTPNLQGDCTTIKPIQEAFTFSPLHHALPANGVFLTKDAKDAKDDQRLRGRGKLPNGDASAAASSPE